jgi:uncharacterized Ntn-hydrolase superfamily protein
VLNTASWPGRTSSYRYRRSRIRSCKNPRQVTVPWGDLGEAECGTGALDIRVFGSPPGANSGRAAGAVDDREAREYKRSRVAMDVQRARLAATYSIVARDPETGELGVAAQSNYFSVGTDVSWAEPGVGAIATQSIIEVSYGPKGLELLSAGLPAQEALDRLVEQDLGASLRQVGIVDAGGRVAAHTGGACVPACAHAFGDGYCVQGNMLASDAVWEAMGPAFEKADGDLAERLMIALEAAETAGGDVRGGQSAALLVVAGERPENPWEGRRIDLHVEDDPRPLSARVGDEGSQAPSGERPVLLLDWCGPGQRRARCRGPPLAERGLRCRGDLARVGAAPAHGRHLHGRSGSHRSMSKMVIGADMTVIG